MNNAILISLVGGGMVFVGLIILWFMMAALVKITSSKKGTVVSEDGELTSADIDLECKQKAAAAAVAAVMAQHKSTFSVSSHKEKEGISPWQNIHRNRQINQSNALLGRKGK